MSLTRFWRDQGCDSEKVVAGTIAQRKKKATVRKQTVASLSTSTLRLDGSRLAVMHANYDSPGVRSTDRSAGQIGGKAF
jgi:hypothetical protein